MKPEYDKIFDLLENPEVKWNKNVKGNSAYSRGFNDHEKLTFGMRNINYQALGLTTASINYPEIFDALMEYGEKYCNFEFTNIHVNKNVVCPPHKDKGNTGISMIVSFGNYKGCNLMVEGEHIETRENPVYFDGKEKLHWNTDDLEGIRYSLVYYTIDLKQKNTNFAEYRVAIPSYNRSDIITEKTLRTLHEGRVPSSCIYIFVANEEEKKLYRKSMPKELYKMIVVGELGITKQRRYIMDYFSEGIELVFIDDDITDVFQATDNKTMSKVENLHKLINQAFYRLDKSKMWGVYPVSNPFFMKPKEVDENDSWFSLKENQTTDLRFCAGCLYGIINHHDMKYYPSIEEKEDYETCIKMFLRDGCITRYNNICIKQQKYSKGGCGSGEPRIKRNQEMAKKLCDAYPDYVSMKTGSDCEVRLKKLTSV
tara:strand:+ start:7752 stop:9029 length:1278 start_codon:yes stop_codon:yes gene_type:complete